jgi:hypothetical protein
VADFFPEASSFFSRKGAGLSENTPETSDFMSFLRLEKNPMARTVEVSTPSVKWSYTLYATAVDVDVT